MPVTNSEVRTKSGVLTGWSVWLGALALQLPALFATVHAFAEKKMNLWQEFLKPDAGALCIWDCHNFVDLAARYDLKMTAFFPGFPLVLRFAHTLLPSVSLYHWAVIVSAALAMPAFALILKAAGEMARQSDGSPPGVGPRALFTGMLVSVFPFQFLWTKGHTEPLFVCLFGAGLLFILRKRWSLGLLWLGLSAACRPQGVLLLACGWLTAWITGEFRKMRPRDFVVASLSLLPFLAYVVWLWTQTGDPFYFLVAQREGWGRQFSIWDGLKWHLPIHPSWILWALSVWAGVGLLRRRVAGATFLGLTCIAMAELPLFCGGYYAYERFMSVNLGLFFVLAEKLGRRPLLRFGVIVWCVSRMVLEAAILNYRVF